MWKERILEALKEAGESWDDIIFANFDNQIIEIDCDTESEDDDIYWSITNDPLNFGTSLDDYVFMFWTAKNVYFSHQYDCYRAVKFAPRNPVTERPENHIGF